MKTYHLLHDIGLHKRSVKASFQNNDRSGPEAEVVRELLARRTQRYTLAELQALSGWFWTAHDECVDENPEDYSHVEVHTSRRKMSDGEGAIAVIASIANEECAINPFTTPLDDPRVQKAIAETASVWER